MNVKLLLKMAPYLAIVALVFVLLFQRNTITDRTAKLNAAEARIGDLNRANRDQAATIANVASRQPDNDAIAAKVAELIGSNTVREVNTRTIIERAKTNDPQVRDWADTSVPGSVRAALRAGSVDADPR